MPSQTRSAKDNQIGIEDRMFTLAVAWLLPPRRARQNWNIFCFALRALRKPKASTVSLSTLVDILSIASASSARYAAADMLWILLGNDHLTRFFCYIAPSKEVHRLKCLRDGSHIAFLMRPKPNNRHGSRARIFNWYTIDFSCISHLSNTTGGFTNVRIDFI